ncbi:hypothetical protein BD324DRAFT_629348 [Kockovaella imperatae]|uniref:Uncharacterized protein n=1 Tax=Kockovaella imperatae TaxID=4999 RepID=A0A1Y1UFN0_9TREE|nr:hypothetical protein BD324DRAFT_629348 [Kockovaella imperatae]ORX35875.1 hypothetical protein BD324DRAFT_629348 [Kockovaella imperatae]
MHRPIATQSILTALPVTRTLPVTRSTDPEFCDHHLSESVWDAATDCATSGSSCDWIHIRMHKAWSWAILAV